MTGWPIEIVVDADRRHLHVTFDDGRQVKHSATDLRVNAPSADVQGHSGGPKPPAPQGKENVCITAVEPIGHYAVRITFDDGHDKGIYTWDRLAG